MSIVSTPKRSSLLALMAVPRPDARLHQTRGKPFLHDAGEGAGVGESVALEFVVQIGMGVDVEDGETGEPAGDRTHDWIGDGVIASESERGAAVIEQ